MLNELGIRLCIYLLSALLIILLGNVRAGLTSKDLSFDISKYKLSLIFLLVFALLIEFNFISYLYVECGYFFIAVSPQSLGKNIVSIIKPYILLPNYMMAGTDSTGGNRSAASNSVPAGDTNVNTGFSLIDSYNPNLEAAKDLLEMFRSLGQTVEYQEKAKNDLKKFFIEIAKFTKESQQSDSPLKAKMVKQLGYYVRD